MNVTMTIFKAKYEYNAHFSHFIFYVKQKYLQTGNLENDWI